MHQQRFVGLVVALAQTTHRQGYFVPEVVETLVPVQEKVCFGLWLRPVSTENLTAGTYQPIACTSWSN